MENCIFCKIINGEIPSSIVFQDDLCIVVMDIQPINQGHVLVIPKEHKEFIYELEDNIAANMLIVANKINRALRKSEIKCEGVNYFLADGEVAFQEVKHAHLHCFPRYKNDDFKLQFSANYINKPGRNELDKIAEQIQKEM